MKQRLLSLLLLLLFLTACSQNGGPPDVAIVPSLAPVAALPSPSPTVDSPVPTALATSTLLPATATLLPTTAPTSSTTPVPTSSPLPTAIPSPTSTPLPTATAVPTEAPFGTGTIIGWSSQDRPIWSYQFGNGPDRVVLVGGIHGGYEWNSTLITYEIMDYFRANPEIIPANLSVHVIPAANPDGIFLVTGSEGRFQPEDVIENTIPGRFNGNGVDLNRNWPCNWEPNGLWRNQEVDAGAYPLSEPENQALRLFIVNLEPVATIFYHSAFNAIFTSGCPETYAPSMEIATVYATAASYPLYEQFTSYPITGDAGDALTLDGVANFTVELSTHYNLDWVRNRNGLLALFTYLDVTEGQD